MRVLVSMKLFKIVSSHQDAHLRGELDHDMRVRSQHRSSAV